nr:MAG TPA: hypothetical protein [Caudoviricetes sp.]
MSTLKIYSYKAALSSLGIEIPLIVLRLLISL